MTASWTEIIAIGAAVGLVFWLVPLVLEFVLLKRFVEYINMDGVQFQQLLATRDAGAFAIPLSQKLSETGILLAWQTQRSLEKYQASERALSPEAYESVVLSLEEYRRFSGLLVGRIAALAWHAGTELDHAPTESSRVLFRSIRRDWKMFTMHCAFLQSFLKNNTNIVTKKV